jgi:hypothetical protein
MGNINEYYTEDLKKSELLEINGGEIDKNSFGYFCGRLLGEMLCGAKAALEFLGPGALKK